jgi:peroxiredoxin
VIIYCVNDAAVMDAWAMDQGTLASDLLTMAADPRSELTKALGMELTAAGPLSKGLLARSKRIAMYVDDGEVKIVRVAEAEDDPAGDDRPDVTLAPAMLEAIKAL